MASAASEDHSDLTLDQLTYNILHRCSVRTAALADLLEFPASTSCAQALRELEERGLSGAPVYDDIDRPTAWRDMLLTETAMPVHARLYLGFVDVEDIAILVLNRGLKHRRGGGFMAALGAMMTHDAEHNVGAAVNLSGHNGFETLTEDKTFADAAALMARHDKRRVAIIDAHNIAIVGMISQLDVLREVNQHIARLGPYALLPVGELIAMSPTSVVTVHGTVSVRECIDFMRSRGVSSAPVVDDSGVIRSVFSFSDVKQLARVSREKTVDVMLDGDVLALLRNDGGNTDATNARAARNDGSCGTPRTPLTVLANDTLATVVEMLVTQHVHQVFVVDEAFHPIGTVSIADVIKALVSHDQQQSQRWRVARLSPQAAAAPAVAVKTFVPGKSGGAATGTDDTDTVTTVASQEQDSGDMQAMSSATLSSEPPVSVAATTGTSAAATQSQPQLQQQQQQPRQQPPTPRTWMTTPPPPAVTLRSDNCVFSSNSMQSTSEQSSSMRASTTMTAPVHLATTSTSDDDNAEDAEAETASRATAPPPLILQLLHDMCVHDFIVTAGARIDRVIDVNCTATLQEALKIMRRNRVSVLPVYTKRLDTRPPGAASEAPPASVLITSAICPPLEKRYVGWLDAADIISVMLSADASSSAESSLPLTGLRGAIHSLFNRRGTLRVEDAVNHSCANPFWALPLQRNMAQAVKVLAGGIHRVVVIDTEDNYRVDGLITQSAVLRFVHAHRDKLGWLASLPVYACTTRIHRGAIATCSASATAREALAALMREHTRGMPVVSAAGSVVASVSVEDVRLLSEEKPKDIPALLQLDVTEFLERVHEYRWRVNSGNVGEMEAPAAARTVTVREEDTFATAVELLVTNRLHRLYIVNAAMAPVGVFSQTDALHVIASHM